MDEYFKEFLDKGAAAYCRRHMFSCCHLCDDMECGDNTNPLVEEIKKNRANALTTIATAEICEWCIGRNQTVKLVGRGYYNFCPMCGRKLSPVA